MAERKLEASSAKPPTPGRKRRGPSNSELRLRRLTAEEPDPAPRGILEIFAEAEPADADAALARDDDDERE
jgi:hypothetical protein